MVFEDYIYIRRPQKKWKYDILQNVIPAWVLMTRYTGSRVNIYQIEPSSKKIGQKKCDIRLKWPYVTIHMYHSILSIINPRTGIPGQKYPCKDAILQNIILPLFLGTSNIYM